MFETNLVVKELPDGKKQLMQYLIYNNGIRDIVVPIGFVTDYASIPRLPIVFLLFEGLANRAATLHDFLYSNPEFSRKYADSQFLKAMLEEGTPKWKAKCAYWAVRLCGGKVRYNAYKITNE
jgi:hypothetical protein